LFETRITRTAPNNKQHNTTPQSSLETTVFVCGSRN